MAKKRLSKKHKNNIKSNIKNKVNSPMSFPKPQIQLNELSSNHVSLCALAPVIEDKKVFEPIHTNVKIPQKKLFYSR